MALPEPGSKDGQNSKQAPDHDDKDFDPTAEALIDEIDDERTLEEEEALNANSGQKVQEELDDLKRESEMPIEELLAYYERMRNAAHGVESNSDEDREDDDDEEEEEEEVDESDEEENKGSKIITKNNDQEPPESSGGGAGAGAAGSKPTADSTSGQTQPKGDDPKQSSGSQTSPNATSQKQRHLTMSNPADSPAHLTTTTSTRVMEQVSGTDVAPQGSTNNQVSTNDQPAGDVTDGACISSGRHKNSMTDFIIDDEAGDMFQSLLGYDLDDSDDMDEDYSYTDDENGNDEHDWRRVIHVGPEYQADVPEGLCEYDDLPPYENKDKLVWNCNHNFEPEQILDYLKRASSISKRDDISISPASVPKISSDSSRLYRERMQDITSSTGSHTIEQNHENINALQQQPPQPQPENLPDVYMSQSRKRVRIDYELEQENALDGCNHDGGVVQNQLTTTHCREENSDSTSQDLRTELSTEDYFQDEEQLLFLLLQCNYNMDEAIRRRKLDPLKYYLHEPMSLWSQDECLGFEHGLRIYGKDFRSIRENKVQTRTHAEVVAFYYLWKKSERHDVYTNQYKLDRKRCLSHPGTTDYMDKFIEDNESVQNASSSSPTPTPTESTVGMNSSVDLSNDNNSVPLCNNPSDTPSIQYINPSQESTIARYHLQLHQPQRDDEGGQNNPVYVDSNTQL